MFFDNRVVELGDRPRRNNRAAVHDVKAVGHVEAEVQILPDEQDAGRPLLAQRRDGVANLREALRIIRVETVRAELLNRNSAVDVCRRRVLPRPHPPKPDRRFSRIRLSGQWSLVGLAQALDTRRSKASHQPRSGCPPAHPLQGGPLADPKLTLQPGLPAHSDAKPCGTIRTLSGAACVQPRHHFPTSLRSTVVTRFSATTDTLTPTGSFVAASRGSLINVTGTSDHSISNHPRFSASRVHSLSAGSSISFGLRRSLEDSPEPQTESSSRWPPQSAALVTDWSFASRCSPPGGIAPMQLRSATGLQCRPGRDFHPAVPVRSQAHERGRPARSRRPNRGRASLGRRAKWSLNGDPQAVVSPTVSGLSPPPLRWSISLRMGNNVITRPTSPLSLRPRAMAPMRRFSPNREIRKNVASLRHIAEAGPRAPIRLPAGQIDSTQFHRAVINLRQPDGGLGRRRLPPTVAAHETHAGAGRHVATHTAENAGAIVTYREVGQ